MDRTLDYDAAGHTVAVSKPGGTPTAVTYNDRGLVTKVTDTTVATYGYDNAGRLATRTDQSGTANFTYNNRGLLQTGTDPLTGGTATYAYTPSGQVQSVAHGTGTLTESFTYDGVGQTKSDDVGNGATSVSSTAYTYDPVGNLRTKIVGPAAVAGAGTNTYSYDLANRLTLWTAPGSAAVAYAWDDNNNRTTAGATTFAYDARNRLTSSVTGGVTTAYTWSARGTLASKKVGTAAAVLTTFDAFDRTITDGTATYTYDGADRIRTAGASTLGWSGLSQDLATDGTTTYSHDPKGNPVASKTGTTAAALISNNHGDITATAALNGTAIASSRAFDPWGKPAATTGAPPSRGYQGDWTDPATARVDMNARNYDPGTGTFTARDSIDDPAMANRYGYTSANPLTQADATGHQAVPIEEAGGGVAPFVPVVIAGGGAAAAAGPEVAVGGAVGLAVGGAAYAGYQIYQVGDTSHRSVGCATMSGLCYGPDIQFQPLPAPRPVPGGGGWVLDAQLFLHGTLFL